MYDRKLLKNNAKVMLRPYYWYAVLLQAILVAAPLVISLLSLSPGYWESIRLLFKMLGAALSGNTNVANMTAAQIERVDMSQTTLNSLFNGVSAAFSGLVSIVLPVAIARFFLTSRENKADLKEIFYPFKKKYGGNLATMYVMNIILALFALIPVALMYIGIIVGTFVMIAVGTVTYNPATGTASSGDAIALILGLLVFIILPIAASIPFYKKTYELSMVPYILADNSDNDYRRAFDISKAMTKGYKWKLFVLDLSFLGWQLLAVLVPFGAIFLNPYIHATKAEAYTFLKARALEKGLALTFELPGFSPAEATTTIAPTETAQSETVAEASETAGTEESTEQ